MLWWALLFYRKEVNPMAITHFSMSIVKASKGQSVVAKAAYQSADRLYCDKDMSYKNYHSLLYINHLTL